MVAYFKNGGHRANAVGLALIAVLGLIAAYASVSMAGTKTGMALALVTTVGPALLYAALTVPLTFPFGIFLAAVPFDGILDTTSGLGTMTRLLGIASVAAMLFYVLRTRKGLEPARPLVVWLLFYLWAAASATWAIDPQTVLLRLSTELQLFAMLIIASIFPVTVRGLRTVIVMAVVGGVAAAIYGIYEFRTTVGIVDTRLFMLSDQRHLNPDHYAAALLLPSALALVMGVSTTSWRVRIGSLGALALLLPAMDLSGSRGAILGLLGIVVYLLVRHPARRQIAAIFGVLVAFVFATSGSAIVQRFAHSVQGGGAGRTDIWKVGWLAFKEHWLFGSGYGNFPLAYDHAFIHVHELMYTGWSRAPHNDLLADAVELGLPGIVLFAGLWIAQFRLVSVVRANEALYPIRLALEASLVGLLIFSMFADILVQKYPWVLFILMVFLRNAALSLRTNETCATPSYRTAVQT